ncbi:MAG TPA: ABC transporter permease [Candidatus Limnocylindria bacterium]|nr:ABC transporter permease [Candidatus Limnocylindria bacterium]
MPEDDDEIEKTDWNRRLTTFGGPIYGGLVSAGMVALPGGLAILSPKFAGAVLAQTAIIAAPAAGIALLLAGGMIDLSAGAMVCLAAVATARLLEFGLGSWLPALVIPLLFSSANLFPGVAITRLRLPSTLVTLGAAGIWWGIAAGLSGGSVLANPVTAGLNGWLLAAAPGGMTPTAGLGLALLVGLGIWVLLTRTVYGRHLQAVGSDPKVAELCGLAVSRTQLTAFPLAGLAFGIGGLLQNSRWSGGDPSLAWGLELDAMAAVMIGLPDWRGGRVSVFGAVLGAVVAGTVRSAAHLVSSSDWLANLLSGGLLLVATTTAAIRSRRPEE